MYVGLVIQIDHLNTKVIIDTVCSDRLSLHISDHVYGRVYSDRPSFHRNDHVCGLVYPLSLHRLIMCMGVSASFHRSDHVYVGVYIQTGHLFIEVILCLDASSDRPSISPQNWSLCLFVYSDRHLSTEVIMYVDVSVQIGHLHKTYVCGRVYSNRPFLYRMIMCAGVSVQTGHPSTEVIMFVDVCIQTGHLSTKLSCLWTCVFRSAILPQKWSWQ